MDDVGVGDHTTESSLELAKACEDGDVAEVKRILADGGQDVNVNFKDEMDLTPLIYATQRGLVEVVQLLILKVRSRRPCSVSLPVIT
jgi:ankyrin repeat protein